MKNGKNVLFKKINKIKNLVYLMIILILMISTIYADDTTTSQKPPTVVLVNSKDVIINFLNSIGGITCYNIKNLGVDDDYWAIGTDWSAGESLIQKQSEIMAEQFKSNYIDKLKENSSDYEYPPAILLGFSQGGLRVRSMAQYIAKNYPDIPKNRIKGIITLDSPNFGGAIANKANAQGCLEAFGRTLLGTMKIFQLSNNILLESYLKFILPIMGNEEQNSFEKTNEQISNFYNKNMPEFIVNEKNSAFEKFDNANDEKATSLLTSELGIKLIQALFNVKDSEWFIQILKGALEYSDIGPYTSNIKKITSEFRPGSNFLNELNSAENVTKYEYSYKRATLIGTNGDLYNIDIARNIANSVRWLEAGIFIGYLYSFFKTPFPLNLFYLLKCAQVTASIIEWNNLPKKFNYWTAGNANNFSHDLLISSENQKLPEYNTKASTYYEFRMSSINHIVPDR